MNHHFKETLLELYYDESSYYYFQGRPMDYRKITAYGAMGEAGEDYYLFIYRDAFEKVIKYGAVLFLYKPYEIKKPLAIAYTDTGVGWERRNIYTRAAAYFLKKQCQNSLAVEGLVRDLYLELKESIRTHSRIETETKEKIETYNFDLSDRQVQVREITPRKPHQKKHTPYVLGRLKLLRPAVEGPERTKKSSARLGVSLVLNEEEYGNSRFQPVIVPVKRDGTYGTVKAALRSQMGKYDFAEIPALLNEFTDHLLYDGGGGQRRNDLDRLETVSRVYFDELSHLLLQLPDELVFYHFDTYDSPFQPLKSIKIKKLEVHFATAEDGELMRIFLVITGTHGSGGSEVEQVLNAGLDFEVLARGESRVYLFVTPPDHQAWFAIPGEEADLSRFLRFLHEVRAFSIDDLESVLEALNHTASAALVIHPDPLPLYSLKFHPTPVLKIFDRDRLANYPERIEMEFDYRSGAGKFLEKNPRIRLVNYEKDKEFEDMCLLLLKNDPLLEMGLKFDPWKDTVSGYYFIFKQGDDLEWLMESSAQYLDRGFKIYSARRKQYIGKTGSTVRIDMNPGIKWLEFKPLLENTTTGETVEIREIDFDNRTITDKRGTLHVVDKEEIEKLVRLRKYAEQHGGNYRVPSANYFLVNTLYDRRMEKIPGLPDKLAHARRLKEFQQVPDFNLSQNFNGTLRNYQAAGFKWLRFLHRYDLSGCLADDMGLGKTVQTLALLQTLKDEGQLNTSLLVLPVSAVSNWEMEIQKFTPGLTFYRHLGLTRKTGIEMWQKVDLVITSYATLRNDIETFKDFRFDFIVLDESQNIKNLTSQVSKAVKILKGNHRLALSGTPIENSSMELWSLYDFLMPGFLGTPEWFRKEWALPVERYKDDDKTTMLKQMIYPFILRRKKEEVEKDLPEKIEVVETLKMEEEQLNLYVETAQYYTDIVTRAIDDQGVGKSAFKILEGMLRLRQICLLPQLVDPAYKSIPSVKFRHFSEMLEDILAEGHKVLVFSQFVKVLAFIRNHLNKKKMNYSYIDGSVNAETRGEMIKTFQEDDKIGVFLLSLKAGGVAINLTAADYVIIFDPWWNPAVEAQAVDRSHRIGQTKKVIVYRLVVKDTIEEKMLALQNQKKELVDKLIASESKAFKNLTKEDIMNLFRF